MKLLLPSPNKLPTDAELECSWGDGTTYNTLVRETQIKYTFKYTFYFPFSQLNDLSPSDNGMEMQAIITHRYPTNGEYNVTCR